MSDEGLNREDGEAIADHALDLAARSGELVEDGAELVFVGSTAVWRQRDGQVRVVTLETELDP